MSCGRVEDRLLLVPLPHLDQIIGVSEIQLGEDLSPLKQLKGRSDEWEGVAVLNCAVVEAPVVDAGSQGIIDVSLHGLSFRSRQGVETTLGARQEWPSPY